jgi:hypothetical protein
MEVDEKWQLSYLEKCDWNGFKSEKKEWFSFDNKRRLLGTVRENISPSND